MPQTIGEVPKQSPIEEPPKEAATKNPDKRVFDRQAFGDAARLGRLRASSREVKPQEQIKTQNDDTVQKQITKKMDDIESFSQNLMKQNFMLRTENELQRQRLAQMNKNKESILGNEVTKSIWKR